tara:strand:+ start:697 stop:1536 length:840 start_codon:yes stop_codon:yes gene_type:complete
MNLLSSKEQFFEFLNERHLISLRRGRGNVWPWTKDEILQEYKFTNVFRERDKTTVWFRENVRDVFDETPTVILATIIFRWFNLISTGKILKEHQLFEDWNSKLCIEVLRDQPRWITGAYIIKSPNGMNKLEGICWSIDQITKDDGLQQQFLQSNTLQKLWEILLPFPYMGPFMAYEVVTDLRHTYVGRDAEDIYTWANPGPGAKRGLNRIFRRELNKSLNRNIYIEEMQYLLEESTKFIHGQVPDLEMRDIEHTLCEFDKYERVRNGEGRPRSKYRRPE